MPKYLRLALIGHPIAHSLSPSLHLAALDFSNLRGEYSLIDITEADFNRKFAEKFYLGMHGFNVTVPHKEKVFTLCSSLSPEAKITGAVNTVKIESENLIGHNTDLIGFKTAFLDEFNHSLQDQTAILLGAGGAARATVIGLAQMGTKQIYVISRNAKKVESFVQTMNVTLQNLGLNCDCQMVNIDSVNKAINLSTVSALINASPLGAAGKDLPSWLLLLVEHLPAGTICFDLVYNRQKETLLTKLALAKNLRATDGKTMLLHQAKAAFQYWTDLKIPTHILSQALANI